MKELNQIGGKNKQLQGNNGRGENPLALDSVSFFQLLSTNNSGVSFQSTKSPRVWAINLAIPGKREQWVL